MEKRRQVTLTLCDSKESHKKIIQTHDNEIATIFHELAKIAIQIESETGEACSIEQAAYYLTCQRCL